MTNRILDFSNSAAHLGAKGGALEIALASGDRHAVAFEDIAAVVLAHPQVTFSQAAVARLAAAGAVVVICNEKFMPVAMTMPVESHWYQAERFIRQAALTEPKRKRLWQQVVKAKIRLQGEVLERWHGSDAGLKSMTKLVGSGDPKNVEARAAKLYWPRLFQDKTFFRSNDEDPRNALLNYGYAVMRASAARAICAAGLHPSFGLHHANKLNAYPLADDLMEPFRPAVDAQVLSICRNPEIPLDMSSPTKAAILSMLGRRFLSNGESRTIFDILGRCAQSLAAVVLQKEDSFDVGLDSAFPVEEAG